MSESIIGRFDDMSMLAYHKEMPGYSKSKLDKINRSVAHYLESLATEEAQTPAMAFGSAFHTRVLQPHIYQSTYAIAPIIDRRTAVGKELYAKFLEESKGKIAISSEDAAQIDEMAKSVLSHPIACNMLTAGSAEQSFFWVDSKTGLQCKCRPDYIRDDGDVFDLKTTDDASYFNFQRSIVKFRYYVQGAFFLDGISEVQKSLHKNFILIAVEKTRPYNVAIYRLDDEALRVGRSAYQEDLLKIKQYNESSSKWAGYPCIVSDIMLPAWME